MSKEYSRKQFLRMFPFGFTGAIHDSEASQDSEEQIFRPPGALPDEKLFLKKCGRSGKCGEACPHDVIFFFGIEDGILENTPYMRPEEYPCRWCKDMPCIEACESGALVKSNDIPPLGIAVIDREICSVSSGILCDVCMRSCPSWIKAIQFNEERQPVVDEDACRGCGLCAYYCDADPGAITILRPD